MKAGANPDEVRAWFGEHGVRGAPREGMAGEGEESLALRGALESGETGATLRKRGKKETPSPRKMPPGRRVYPSEMVEAGGVEPPSAMASP